MANQKQFDPYSELGVPRNVTPAEIKKAYRRKAKSAHPDAGGDRESFERCRRAMLVLSDPVRRDKFDATGTIDPDEPNNSRATALQIIEQHLGALTNKFIALGRSPQFDPRKIDVIAAVKAEINAEIQTSRRNIKEGQDFAEYLTDLRSRFSIKKSAGEDGDPIGRGFEIQIDRCRAQIAEVEKAISDRQLALEILKSYSFRRDEAETQKPRSMNADGISGFIFR